LVLLSRYHVPKHGECNKVVPHVFVVVSLFPHGRKLVLLYMYRPKKKSLHFRTYEKSPGRRYLRNIYSVLKYLVGSGGFPLTFLTLSPPHFVLLRVELNVEPARLTLIFGGSRGRLDSVWHSVQSTFSRTVRATVQYSTYVPHFDIPSSITPYQSPGVMRPI